MKKLWVFGGSYCSGYYRGAGDRDWIAQLNADVSVFATTPQSPLSQYLMLTHALEHHELPDFVIYDYPPCHRVQLPSGLSESELSMTNFWNWCNSSTGETPECGCVPDTDPDRWGVRDLNWLDPEGETAVNEQFLLECQRKLIKGELPDTLQHKHTIQALTLLQEHELPHVWFSVHNEGVETFVEFMDNYLDIMTLNGTVPTQNYNSKTFNHLSIQQNLMWSRYFNSEYLTD